ncbi:MAG TPA: hypothetical protein VJ486_13760 [Geothrix sp.]|nr:hypothetical protein [Geothrix sp.]
MRWISVGLGSLALLAALACQPQPTRPMLYGPWEEGLTLAYEDPTLPPSQRRDLRLQIRVAQSRIGPNEPGLVRLEYTSLKGQLSLLVRHGKGGITLLAQDGRPLAQLLPEGFPATATWTNRGTAFHVIGRAAWDAGTVLPPGSDAVGFWVEAVPPAGPRSRTLYLPDLGEVETREWRDGAWVTVNRLVARGFTDLPSAKPAR